MMEDIIKQPKWKEVQYSRSQIISAGQIIRNSDSTVEDNKHAIEIIDNWREAHAFPLHVIYMHLRRMAESNPRVIVAERLKRLESITSKLRREQSMSLWTMQDLGGCRVIVENISDVYRYAEMYDKSKKRHVKKKTYFKSKIKIVTIALNPSKNEFPEAFDPTAKPRFIVKSLVTDELYVALNEYFKFNPYKNWFSHFESYINMLGASFGGIMSKGIKYENIALSIDYYSSIATNPTFSKLFEYKKNEIDQRALFFDLLRLLSPDIAIMSTAREYFYTVFDKRDKIIEVKGKTEIYKTNNLFAIWGRNINGMPYVDKHILTEWINEYIKTRKCTPKEGVIWAMSLD